LFHPSCAPGVSSSGRLRVGSRSPLDESLCPLVVTSRLSSLLRNGRQPGRPPSGPCSPFAAGCLSSTAEAQNSRSSARPRDCSPLQSYIAPGGTSDFRRRYPRALRNPDSSTAEAVNFSSSLCLRVLPRPRNARLSRDMRLSWGLRPYRFPDALKERPDSGLWVNPERFQPLPDGLSTFRLRTPDLSLAGATPGRLLGLCLSRLRQGKDPGFLTER
jgi:hypothetical protein